jgi:hypothetical protein
MKRLRKTTEPKQRDWALATTVYLLLGPLIWVLHFTAIYAVQSTLCALGTPARTVVDMDIVPIAVLLATVLLLSLLAGAMWGLIPIKRKPGSADQLASPRFFEGAMKFLCLLAVIGIIWTSIAASVLHPCAPLR